MLRLYSEQDITRLRFIKYLVDGLRMNLAGVEFALEVLNRLLEVRQRLAAIELEEGLREKLGQQLELMRELLDEALPTAE
jgi:DNA-binding transcriptional MerR regulator